MVAEAKDLGKSYGAKQVFRASNFVIERGDRIALVGVNGAGKSTLIKLLAGSEPATSGELRLGHNADVDYFAQDQYKALDPNARMLDDLLKLRRAPRKPSCAACSGASCFPRMTYSRPSACSPAENAIVTRWPACCCIHRTFCCSTSPPTISILRAKDVLLDSLQKFTGTVVFVSHDRYFIDKLATRVFEIGDGRVEVFPGNYEDYSLAQGGKGDAKPDVSFASPHCSIQRATPSQTNHDEPESAEPETKQKRLNPIKLKQMKERVQEVEEEIARFEAAIATAETALQNFVSVEETQRQTDLLNRSKSDLEQAMNEWEELSQTLEAQIEA